MTKYGNIIKKINSEKLFGENPKELLLNREDREKLVKIKRFFGAEPQLLKLYEEIEELQTAYRNYRKTFYKNEQNLIEEIADCFDYKYFLRNVDTIFQRFAL